MSESSSDIVKKEDIKKIFSNIEIIYHLHKELLRDLLNCITDPYQVGPIFKKRVSFSKCRIRTDIYVVTVYDNLFTVW